ncbi:MAG: peptide deformylase [Gammaproteobacteria bacterium RBG_16_57_12]|nr:MAG: peptide deformylase [Gammaproteobacteria bacterium RBG_16_57_12]
MAILKILHFPDPRLRLIAEPVKQVDNKIRQLLDDMLETMYDAPGVGLAASQVNVPLRVIVVDISQQKNDPLCLINPKILLRGGSDLVEEGCLSVPGIYEMVERASNIKVRALDRNGSPFEAEVDDLLSVCIQHEIDHLDGKVFVDYLSRLKQERIIKKMEKLRRRED